MNQVDSKSGFPDFNSPRDFVPPLTGFIDLSRPNSDVPDWVKTPLPGQMKVLQDCTDFIVREPVPNYPGMPEYMRTGKRRFLTAGPESDMPGLRFDGNMYVHHNGRRAPAVAFTVYKWGTGTWPVQDAIAKGLSFQLRRTPQNLFNPKDVVPSGLKDRKARTVQTFVVIGLTIEEAQQIDWTKICWSAARSGFFVKDIRPTDVVPRMGSHGANFFDVRIRVPGMTREQLEEYMAPRAEFLRRHDFLVPNYFHRQRLGPGQDMQRKGLVLLSGDYQSEDRFNPLMTNVEKFVHSLLFSGSARDEKEITELRAHLAGLWQFRFEDMDREMRDGLREIARRTKKHWLRHALSLEYEIVRRLSDMDRFGGCCEAVLYDLKSRLSLCVGAWQGFYWNWEVYNQIQGRRLSPQRNATVPLPMSCEDAKRTYRRTPLGQQCLTEMAVIEQQSESADAYLEAYIADHWARFEEKYGSTSARVPRDLQRDELDLSFDLVRSLFNGSRSVNGMSRPDSDALSAALVKRMYLIPRDASGRLKDSSIRRKAFTRAEDFEYSCDDEVVRIRTWLRSGSYFTTLANALFDTSDPEENEDGSSNGSDGEAA